MTGARTLPDGVGKLPWACGQYSSGPGRLSRAHPFSLSRSRVIPARFGCDQSSDAVAISSSLRRYQSMSRPMRRRQPAEQLDVRHGLTERLDRRLVQA